MGGGGGGGGGGVGMRERGLVQLTKTAGVSRCSYGNSGHTDDGMGEED